MSGCLQTGQVTCHDQDGREIGCEGTGQDAEFKAGVTWPVPRFSVKGDLVLDRLTGLEWARNASIVDYPVTWQEALDFVSGMNRQQAFGAAGWRLPNRRELRSIMSHQTRKPALPQPNPFINVFSGWYWTSTTSAVNPSYAWYVHTEGARMFYGSKTQYFLLWPVRGEGARVLMSTGQRECFDGAGARISCMGTGQDGELRLGRRWPVPRFERQGGEVLDRLTGLRWQANAGLTEKPVTWNEALSCSSRLGNGWRLPNINELESLVDSSRHGPALPEGHQFRNVQEGYWSSTTSMFEPDWAWALYLTKGAVGVGQKQGVHFFVWLVRE